MGIKREWAWLDMERHDWGCKGMEGYGRARLGMERLGIASNMEGSIRVRKFIYKSTVKKLD